MVRLSQRNPIWCTDRLGASSLTVGRFGCLTTALSMLSDYFGGYVSPSALAHNAANYTPMGLVIWENLKFKKMKFVSRSHKRDDAAIKAALKDPNRGVLLNVNKGAHWVVGLRPTLFGNSYIVADPWSGKDCDVLKVYHDVTGFVLFTRT